MTLALSMTGGLEWIMIPFAIILIVMVPLIAFRFYKRQQGLKRRLEADANKRKNIEDADLIV